VPEERIAEVEFLVSYTCSACLASLQAPAERPTAWLRCPVCGRGGLPPDDPLRKKPFKAGVGPGEDLLVIGPPPEPRGMTPVASTGVGRGGSWGGPPADDPAGRPGRPGSLLRVVSGTLLFVSLTLLLFSYLEKSVIGTSVFGTVALVSVALLILAARGRRED